ncbi:MAG: hypothetical protein AAGF12_42680 [Myxococcota bacterium]
MQKILPILMVLALGLAACGDDDDTSNPDATPNPDGSVDGNVGDADPDGGETDPCDNPVEVSGEVTTATTWDQPCYELTEKVFVTNNAVLTVNAGVTVVGRVGGADETALIVTRGAQLVAEGTAAEPIVFTSGNPEGARETGQWAGVALLGDAPINNGTCDPTCVNNLEGIEVADMRGLYGGTNATSSCGSLEYVRIEFAGAEFSPNNELNGLTLAGCGSGTTLSYIQVHRGKDDGIEFFGGTANMDHVIISGASDDSLDWDQGWTGQVQFLVVHQFAGVGDNGFEADNRGRQEDAMPRSNPTIFNATLIGTPDTRGMRLREGTHGTLRNFIVFGFGSEALDLQTETDLGWPANLSIGNSFFTMNGDYTVEDVALPAPCMPATFDDDACDAALDALGDMASRVNDDLGFIEADGVADATLMNDTSGVDPMFTAVSDTAPNYIPANAALAGQATPTFGDTTATYAGAFEPNAATNWAEGWTAYPVN